jgi:uncharacterized protein (TIGR02594 family)
MKPAWLGIAEKELGTHEIAGAGNNRRIIEYHLATTLKASSDSVPWCSSFANWCMKEAGFPYTGSAAARSWLHYGYGLKNPEVGCIVVLKRGAPPSGHVCFFVEDLGDNIRCLGGNQGDEVKYSVYPKTDVLAYRWPEREAIA